MSLLAAYQLRDKLKTEWPSEWDMTERGYERNNAAVRFRGRHRKTTFGENGGQKQRRTHTMKRTLTKGERLLAEMCGDISTEGYPVLTEAHPFLRKVIAFTEKRNEWIGTVSDLLMAVGDEYTPPNTAAKLLRKYEYDLLYPNERGL